MNATITIEVDIDTETEEEAEQKARELVTMLGHPTKSIDIEVDE